MVQAYCFRCKAMRTIQNPRVVIAKNGSKMVVGSCPKCGNKLSKIMKK